MAIACFAMASPLFAADDGAAESEPVWVISYTGFILFAGATIVIALFFSRRGDSVLDVEEQKRVAKLRTDRITKRRKEERQAMLHAQKKRR